jgi:hypothetical protein
MISSHRTGLPSPRTGRIAASAGVLAFGLALGCVPAADEGEETGNDPTTATITATGSATETGSGSVSADATDASAESGTTEPLPDVSFNADIQPILDENCVTGVAGQACHTMGGSWATTIFTPDVAYQTMLEGDPLQSLFPYIAPNDPEMSYVWHKINNTQAPPVGTGLPMPSIDTSVEPAMDPGPLPAEDIETFRVWILQGAPET